jgi:hypothetical protein
MGPTPELNPEINHSRLTPKWENRYKNDGLNRKGRFKKNALFHNFRIRL